MRTAAIYAPIALSLMLAACGEEAEPNAAEGALSIEAQATATPVAGAGAEYSATGDVTEVSADQVTISHGPVEALGWPAMTMSFEAPSGQMLEDVDVGDPVAFDFRQAGEEYVLTSLREER